jgi:hypothetical protein
MVQPVPEILAA